MKEKIKGFLQSEKFKNFTQKMFSKKTIAVALIAVILAAALNFEFHLLFDIRGVVKGIDGTKVKVANFFITRTVDVGNGVDLSGISIGDRIRITKNIAGEVLTVDGGRWGHGGDFFGRGFDDRSYGKGDLKGFGGQKHGNGRGGR